MKYLTDNESQKWLASMGVRIDGNQDLLFPNAQAKTMSTMPRRALALSHLSARLVAWLSCSSGRIIWLSNWTTYPDDQLALFEKVRLGCGESRSPIEAPGHLFDNSAEDDNSVMTGLVFLIMAFNWEAYLVARSDENHIFLGDEYIAFFSDSKKRLGEATELISDFNLEIITDIRSAWK